MLLCTMLIIFSACRKIPLSFPVDTLIISLKFGIYNKFFHHERITILKVSPTGGSRGGAPRLILAKKIF